MSLEPYRSPNPDKHDKNYATKLKERFSVVSVKLQNHFQEFTQNLMDEDYINRFELLKATDAFQLEYEKLITESDDWAWGLFLEAAYNYRPYNVW